MSAPVGPVPPPASAPPPWPPAPYYWQPAMVPQLPALPGATTAMTLGIIAVAGGFVLALPFALAPIAWYLGARAKRLAEREPGQWRGEGSAKSGMVLGIVGSAFLAVAATLGLVVTILGWITISIPSPY